MNCTAIVIYNLICFQYTFFLCLIFILQIAAAITAFTLITKADSVVEETLTALMLKSQWELASKIDWIQATVIQISNRKVSIN